MYRGQLVKWNEDKGFGFIKTPELTSDTFIHISALKHMSSKPKRGDYVHFDVETQNGKTRATNARIEGVKVNQRLRVSKTYQSRSNNNLIYAAVIIGIAAFLYSRLGLDSVTESKPAKIPVSTFLPSASQTFTCDGRQHCSQMTSRAEAKYFIKHCPNTKMDGDNDGIPCENDSRF